MGNSHKSGAAPQRTPASKTRQGLGMGEGGENIYFLIK